jgi:hypothetical protein
VIFIISALPDCPDGLADPRRRLCGSTSFEGDGPALSSGWSTAPRRRTRAGLASSTGMRSWIARVASFAAVTMMVQDVIRARHWALAAASGDERGRGLLALSAWAGTSGGGGAAT